MRSRLRTLFSAIVLLSLPQNSYTCRYPPCYFNRMRALPFASWANVYLQSFKVAASFRPAPTMAAKSLLAAAPVDTLSKDAVTVDVVLMPAGVRCFRATVPQSYVVRIQN